ncbi:hypothetical protein D3C81_1339200 [compost metagenome]
MTLYHRSWNESANTNISNDAAFNYISNGYFKCFFVLKALCKDFPSVLAVDCTFGKNKSFFLVIDAYHFSFNFLSYLNSIRSVIQMNRR